MTNAGFSAVAVTLLNHRAVSKDLTNLKKTSSDVIHVVCIPEYETPPPHC